MPPPSNDRLLRALRRQPVDRTPVWLMRQAGRYLPEYREVRERAGSFMTLCSTPELACEVTLQPLRRFALDAAILFSDILTVPDAMGLGLQFEPGEGPTFDRPVRTSAEVARLGAPDPEIELAYVMDAVRTVRREIDGAVPLIGFAGSPWTLATYMVEGRGGNGFPLAKAMLFEDPACAHRLLDVLARAVADYLLAQIRAGVQAVMIFDTWGGILTPAHFHEFSLAYMRRIVDTLASAPEDARVPVILFTKGASGWLEAIADSGCDAVGIDWTVDLAEARRRIGARVALQGNLDPGALYASPERIRDAVATVLASFGEGAGHVFNLGHGLQPGMDPERVAACVEAVHALSPAYHGATGNAGR